MSYENLQVEILSGVRESIEQSNSQVFNDAADIEVKETRSNVIPFSHDVPSATAVVITARIKVQMRVLHEALVSSGDFLDNLDEYVEIYLQPVLTSVGRYELESIEFAQSTFDSAPDNAMATVRVMYHRHLTQEEDRFDGDEGILRASEDVRLQLKTALQGHFRSHESHLFQRDPPFLVRTTVERVDSSMTQLRSSDEETIYHANSHWMGPSCLTIFIAFYFIY